MRKFLLGAAAMAACALIAAPAQAAGTCNLGPGGQVKHVVVLQFDFWQSQFQSRPGVIGEAMVALVLAQAFLEKFGGDSLTETRRNYDGFLEQVRTF